MSERILLWLLNLYPRSFRGEYGDAMRQLLRDRLAAETGPASRARLWFDVLRDLAASLPREYRRRPRRAPAAPGHYRMSEEAVAALVRSGHLGDLRSLFFSIATGLLTGWLRNAPRWPLCAIYGLLALFLLHSQLSLRRFQSHWRHYELSIDGARIQQLEHGAVTRTLTTTEIAHLRETEGRGIAIQTHDPRKSIRVPALLTGYEEMRNALAAIMPLEQLPHRPRAAHTWLIALYPAALLVQPIYLAGTLTAVLTAYLLHKRKSQA